MSKKILILDIEGMSGKRPYNIGCIVADKEGNIYEEVSLACMPTIWENLSVTFVTSQERAKVMTHKNIEEILEKPDKYQWLTIEQCLNVLENLIAKYNISETWAYNCSFDKAGITLLMGDMLDKYPMLAKVKWFDIWSAIIMTRCLTRKYVRYCRKHGFVTEKGNIKTSAETVYAYLTKDEYFEEEHTGLADCHIEYYILLTAYKSHKKMRGDISQPWKLVKDFVEREGL